MRVLRLGSFTILLGALLQAQTAPSPTPVVGNNGIVNAATFASQEPVTPGALVSIFGTDLASSTAFADTIPLSTSLANVSVTMNGVPAPLLAVVPGSGQINAQIPWNVLPSTASVGTVTLVVTRDGVQSSPAPVQIGNFSPGIFSLQFGTGQGAVTTGDGTAFVAPVGSIQGANARPARVGDVIIIYATGLGPVDTPMDNGAIPPPGKLVHTITIPTVLIGGVAAHVEFSGLSPQFVGVNQLNVTIMPGTPAGDKVPIQLQVGGITTTDKVTIAITQ